MPFDDAFVRDTNPSKQTQDTTALSTVERCARGMTDFLSSHAGASYGNGLYRIHHIAHMPRWTDLVLKAFPDFRGRLFCFAYDWLGRMFSLDFERKANGQFLVLMLEPGTGQALEIPATFMDFHNEELVTYQNEALAVDFYNKWQESGGRAPNFQQCVGYRCPLFLNGSDVTENLDVTDLEVYWSIAAQLLSKARGLSEGTRIRHIRISD